MDAHQLRAVGGQILFVWAQLHGAISLEVFQQLPDTLMPSADLFDQQMRASLALLGRPSRG